jgi:SAM-dependent methyltransferase
MVASPKTVDESVYDAIYKLPGGPPGYDRNLQLAREAKRKVDPLTYLASRSDAFWAVDRALARTRARTVLEIGCGLGHLTYALRKAGYEASAIDLSAEAVEAARAAFGDFYRAGSVESLLSEPLMRFDAIVMVEVVEHLEAPLDVLKGSMRLLNPGGCLILTTPNRTYFGYDAAWTTDLPPVHLWWFSEPSLEAVARALNCSVSFIDFSAYSARFPQVIGYTSPRDHMLDESGRLIRRENALVSSARRLGILHEAHWFATSALGRVGVRGHTEARRSTMAATLSLNPSGRSPSATDC